MANIRLFLGTQRKTPNSENWSCIFNYEYLALFCTGSVSGPHEILTKIAKVWNVILDAYQVLGSTRNEVIAHDALERGHVEQFRCKT